MFIRVICVVFSVSRWNILLRIFLTKIVELASINVILGVDIM